MLSRTLRPDEEFSLTSDLFSVPIILRMIKGERAKALVEITGPSEIRLFYKRLAHQEREIASLSEAGMKWRLEMETSDAVEIIHSNITERLGIMLMRVKDGGQGLFTIATPPQVWINRF